METNKKLLVLLKNPINTSLALDFISKEIKEESTKIYDEVFKDFKNEYRKEFKELKLIAEKRIEEISKKIRNKHFNNLERSSLEIYK